MSFMQKQVERMQAWLVETTCGTECIPADVVGLHVSADSFRDFLEGDMRSGDDGEFDAELVAGWFCRLSAPGYMDCTEWSGPFETELGAYEYLKEMYEDDESEETISARW